MTRTYLLLAAAAVPLAAPVPRAAEKPLYHPTKIGAKRVYRVTHHGSESTLAMLVTAVEAKDGAFVVTEERWITEKGQRDSDAAKGYYKLRISDDGVYGVACKVDEAAEWDVHKKPCCFLKTPARPGDTWKNVNEGEEYTITETVGGPERVKVPAGEFEAVVVRRKAVHKGHEYPPQTLWYAARVGMVKWVMGDELEEVLLSYTSGKD